MSTNIQNIAILTSGGDSAGMNACIRAIVRVALYHKIKVYGVIDGFNGLIDDQFREMNYDSVSNIISRGGTILGTERSERFFDENYRKLAIEHLKNKDITTVIVIGGDGSYKGIQKLNNEFGINFIGIPGTIDNDIEGSNYSIGFDTALNNITESIDKIRDTASSHHRIFLVEVMGNTSGVLALHSAIATGAEDAFLPEREENLDLFEEKIRKALIAKKSSIIIVSEGDQMGGAKELYDYLKVKQLHHKVRVSILGHLQRGGNPTFKDRMMATQFGVKAIELIINNDFNQLIGTQNGEVYAYAPTKNTTKTIPKDINSIHLIKKLSKY